MGPVEDRMETSRALSYREQWRVRGYLVRGEAPSDPRMAVAAVELAERYQRRGRIVTKVMRWWPAFMIVVFGFATFSNALEGDTGMTIVYAVIVLGSLAQLLFDPIMRPKQTARSLEASRRVIAQTPDLRC